MQILDRIESQMTATGLPLVGITLAAVPCPDTPVILTLHWHGFIKQKLVDLEEAEAVAYTSIPSSTLQLNERWHDLVAVDRAAMDAGWELGAWDVARSEQPACLRPGAAATEALECLQAFGAYPHSVNGAQVAVSDAPDTDDLVELAANRGYLLWSFRPVCGGIWKELADDATLTQEGRRPSPCPHLPVPPACSGKRRTVYRFGFPVHRALPVPQSKT
ncbi:MAG: diguanylate cyclase [Burkholderiales bacterium]|nr:diguanylate cyclase [Burkholderiales bacterium]MDP2399893.1 diguanylate cyclase [Burkholderiales bacterium]